MRNSASRRNIRGGRNASCCILQNIFLMAEPVHFPTLDSRRHIFCRKNMQIRRNLLAVTTVQFMMARTGRAFLLRMHKELPTAGKPVRMIAPDPPHDVSSGESTAACWYNLPWRLDLKNDFPASRGARRLQHGLIRSKKIPVFSLSSCSVAAFIMFLRRQ